jgi:hypothetical protein
LGVIETTGFAPLLSDCARLRAVRPTASGHLLRLCCGSAAGSFVSYCLGITDIDPIEYDLTFERFLNPERIQMPDIDMDFEDARRDLVIRYVREKYGDDRVRRLLLLARWQPKPRCAMSPAPSTSRLRW